MQEQDKSIEVRRRKDDKVVYSTDGKNHQVTVRGDAAKGVAAAASAAFGFIIGFILMS